MIRLDGVEVWDGARVVVVAEPELALVEEEQAAVPRTSSPTEHTRLATYLRSTGITPALLWKSPETKPG